MFAAFLEAPGVSGMPSARALAEDTAAWSGVTWGLVSSFVASLMGRVNEVGKYASWIAPPIVGINKQPLNFEYVRFN